MKLKFDVTAAEYQIIAEILLDYLTCDCKVWVFGSRAKNTARFNSDIDLAIECDEPLKRSAYLGLEEDFNDARIAYAVDVVDMHEVSDKFRTIINSHKVPFPLKFPIPALRFPEFTDPWHKATMDETSSLVTSGSRDWSKFYSESGDKFIRMTNLSRTGIDLLLDDLKYVKLPADSTDGLRTSLQHGDVLISITAELGKIGWIPANFGTAYINQHTALVRLNKAGNSKFIAYLLSSAKMNKKLNRLNDSGAKSGLNLSTIRSFDFYTTSDTEQQKIADFLTAVDTKIQQLKRKHSLMQQYKKGVMQQLFSQQVRFKDDDGRDYPDWEEKRLGDVFERVTRKNKKNCKNVMTISAQQGLINQEEYFNKSVSAADVTGYYLLQKGDFAYNKSYSAGYPLGAIKKLNRYGEGVVSTLYICFKAKENVVSDFYEQYFEGGLLNREIHKIAQEGARNHGLLNVSVVEFFRDIQVLLPDEEEQRKIADFLGAIDTKIQQLNAQITQAETFKKGLLQQMFV